MIKPKTLLTVVLPALLVIGGSWYYLAHPMPNLEVKEEHTVYRIGYTYPFNRVVDNDNVSMYSLTLINGGSGFLNLSIVRYTIEHAIEPFKEGIAIEYHIVVCANLPDNLVPKGIKLEAKGIDDAAIVYDFLYAHNEGINATPWPDDKVLPGAWSPKEAFIGFQPHSSSFKASTALYLEIYDEHLNATDASYTLEITAELLGFSKPVKAVMDVTLYNGMRR